MLTEALLEQVCRSRNAKPNPALIQAMAGEKANALYAQYGIAADPRTMAAFMASVCHETGGLSLIRENPNYTATNLMKVWGMWYGIGKKGRDGKVNVDSDGDGLSDLAEAHGGHAVLVMSYNYNRATLGNRKGSTDGYDYRGGGPLQSTGRDNYQWLERETGIAFGSNPKLIENPEHWPLVACLTFTKKVGNLCRFAAEGNFEAVCKAINCGSPVSTVKVVGMDEREAWLRAWTRALADACPADGASGTSAAIISLGVHAVPPAAVVYKYGSPQSKAVGAIQARLNELMYAEGKLVITGGFGARTRSAVTDFQMENHIEPFDGIVGSKTWVALFAKDAKPFPPPASAQMGVAALHAAGDVEVKQASAERSGGVALGLAALPALASNSGGLEFLRSTAEAASGAQSYLVTILDVVKFGSGYVLPIAALLAAYLLYRRFGAVAYDRVERWSRPVGGA